MICGKFILVFYLLPNSSDSFTMVYMMKYEIPGAALSDFNSRDIAVTGYLLPSEEKGKRKCQGLIYISIRI